MIIGIVGYIGSGKSTVADILVRYHNYRKFAFADALKDAVAVIFQWPRELLEGDTNASRAFRDRVDTWWSYKFGYEVTPRIILQKFGTEACRHGISDNIWITALEKRIHGYDDVIIPDCRFSNEIEFIRNAGGKIIHVKRGEDPTPEQLAKLHVSETAWNSYEPDRTIHNDKDVEGLKGCVSTLLTDLEKEYKIQHTL